MTRKKNEIKYTILQQNSINAYQTNKINFTKKKGKKLPMYIIYYYYFHRFFIIIIIYLS